MMYVYQVTNINVHVRDVHLMKQPNTAVGTHDVVYLLRATLTRTT